MSRQRSRHKALLAAGSIVFACVAVTGCQSVQNRPVTPISTVVESAQSGAGAELIVGQTRAAGTTYALRGSDFANLAERGVPGPVLDELQQNFFRDVESLSQRWFTRRTSAGPTSIFPQPLDLDTLDSGGNGMAPRRPMWDGRRMVAARPECQNGFRHSPLPPVSSLARMICWR